MSSGAWAVVGMAGGWAVAQAAIEWFRYRELRAARKMLQKG